jgi:hypothetical protein
VPRNCSLDRVLATGRDSAAVVELPMEQAPIGQVALDAATTSATWEELRAPLTCRSFGLAPIPAGSTGAPKNGELH